MLLEDRAVILCSGGMDSVTVLNLVAKVINSKNLLVLFVNYNQKTKEKERQYSKIAAERINAKWIEFNLLDLPNITKTSLIHDGSNSTEVQGRNTIFIGIGSALAQTNECNKLYIGLQSADVIYGDAQPKYFEYMKKAIATAYGIELIAPLLHNTKEEIFKIAIQLNLDLNMTYSCYFNDQIPCGLCPSCKVRINAESSVR